MRATVRRILSAEDAAGGARRWQFFFPIRFWPKTDSPNKQPNKASGQPPKREATAKASATSRKASTVASLDWWRARQDSNLQPSDLESDALPIRATDPRARRLLDLYLFVLRMAAAARAELFDGKLFSLTLLISATGVITPLTSVTLEPN